ncbi:MAG: hypothetical protein ABFD97_10765 [Syntrophobacter sp.]
MITWRRCGIRIAEAWFDEPTPSGGIDLVYLIQRPVPEPGALNQEFKTILLDLRRSEKDLRTGLKGNTRYEIRRAEKEGLSRESHSPGDGRATMALCEFYNHFAAHKGISGIRHSDVVRYASARMLDLSLCRDKSGKVIAWHSHIVTRGRARLLHSASLLHEREDIEDRNIIGRANRYLHWKDILRFKAGGFAFYDFGGWYDGQTDKARIGINRFKKQFGGCVVREFNCQVTHTLRGWMASRIRRMRRGAE